MSATQVVPQASDIGIDQLCINTIRTLSIDAVQQAKSGHPGTPMALAPLVYTIWNRLMRFDPKDPIWPNRDRFILSNGHASMLVWSLLHLTKTQAVNAEYENLGQPAVTLDDIRNFRRGTPSTTWSRELKPRQVRWGRALPPASAWPSRRSGSPIATTGRTSISSTTTFMPSAAMAA
jgi:hypothetical protein